MFEKLNVNLVISASNIFAINILVICDNAIPISNPTAKDINPIINVSISKRNDIFLLDIPSVIYIPNSLFLFFIKNLEAYIIKNPNIKETKTETYDKTCINKSIISCCLDVTVSIAV